MPRTRPWLPVAACALLPAACGGSEDSAARSSAATASPYPGYSSEAYAGTANWLSHPALSSLDDVCATDLRTTAVAKDGQTTELGFAAAREAPFDCFYVYPTTSLDPGTSSDRNPGRRSARPRPRSSRATARYAALSRRSIAS